MKKCANCDFECSDEATNCPACSTDTFVSSSPEVIGHIISPEEDRFWKRMTFRQFAVILIRIQGLWFLFDSISFVTYLPSYWSRLHEKFLTPSEYSDVRTAFFWELFRLAYHIAAGVLCLQYADRIISWLVKDIIPKQPSNTPPAPANRQPPAANS